MFFSGVKNKRKKKKNNERKIIERFVFGPATVAVFVTPGNDHTSGSACPSGLGVKRKVSLERVQSVAVVVVVMMGVLKKTRKHLTGPQQRFLVTCPVCGALPVVSVYLPPSS